MIDHVLILAAGRSTRIAPLAQGVPKPLVSIAGKPIVAHALEWLAGCGITAAWVNLHHRADVVRQALGDGPQFGVRLQYSYEAEILGTAGGWKNLLREWTATSLVVYGDNLMRFDLAPFLRAHREGNALATVALFDPSRHPNTGMAGGRVRVDAEGLIERFDEGAANGDGGLVNAGAYLLEPGVGDRIGAGFQDFGWDVFPRMAVRREIRGYLLDEEAFCLGLDTPETFNKAEELIRNKTVRLG